MFRAIRYVAETELRCFEDIIWEIEPEAERQSENLAPFRREAVFYATREVLRNAARHGRGGEEKRSLHLRVSATGMEKLEIVVGDGGVGLGAGGVSHGGSGQGLARHSTMMAVIGGTLSVESQPGVGVRIRIALREKKKKKSCLLVHDTIIEEADNGT